MIRPTVATLLVFTCLTPASVMGQSDHLSLQHVVIDREGPADMHTKTTGDLNGDGLIDLIVAGTRGQIVWYEYPAWNKHVIATGGGGWSTDAETGDLDRDGDTDIVISDWYQNNRLVWFENRGPLTPSWAMHRIGEPRAHDIELGDLDRDGDLDIVTRQQGEAGKTLEVWIQDTPQSWHHTRVSCPTGEGLTLADVDRDGDLDPIIAGRWYATPADPMNESWAEHRYGRDWAHEACVVKSGDFDADGRVDIALTPAESQGGRYRIAWFQAPIDPADSDWNEYVVDASVETVLHSLDVADMNNDGRPDIVTAEMHQGRDPDEVLVYLNGARGRTWTKQVIATVGSHAVRAIDVGHDGDFDLFGANWSQSTTVDLWENSANPGLASNGILPLDRWTYVRVDSSRASRAFGLAMRDLTGDGLGDIASGQYFYRNPGGDMSNEWSRTTFPIEVDALLALDVDEDALGDLIGIDSTGGVHWLETKNPLAESWKSTRVGHVQSADHGLSSQGYTLGQLIPGGRPEIIVSVGAVYLFTIPDDPESGDWPRTVVTDDGSPEGLAVGDVDRDGDLDLCGGAHKGSGRVVWWSNPGDGAANWPSHDVGTLPSPVADRFYAADVNGDRRLDIVVSAANGTQNGVYWWEQPDDPASLWRLHTVAVQDTTNSMDVADMDGDGDVDIISGEHRGPKKVSIWENDGHGRFVEHVVSTGHESHLGTRVFDLDGDGDLDIVSIAWDHHALLHLWRNDARSVHEQPE